MQWKREKTGIQLPQAVRVRERFLLRGTWEFSPVSELSDDLDTNIPRDRQS